LQAPNVWRSISAASVLLALGSDAPVEPTDVFGGLAAAISRTDANDEPFGGWSPQEAISREMALAGYTIDGAYAGFAEGHFDRLIPGERADFILVDRDPLRSSPDDIRATRIHETWINGERVYQARPVQSEQFERKTAQ